MEINKSEIKSYKVLFASVKNSQIRHI